MNDVKVDSGLMCLAEAARLLEVSTDYLQLERVYGNSGSDCAELDIVRAAKAHGLRAGLRHIKPDDLDVIPLPVIIKINNGGFCLFYRRDAGYHVFDPEINASVEITREVLLNRWLGIGVVLAKGAPSAAIKAESFAMRRMLPVIWKHKKQLYRVLAFTLLVQLLGLIAPLFSKEIIDNVLVHHSVATLNVLLSGMLFTAIFIVVFEMLRVYVFAYAATRIDTLLSADVFNHVLRLPMKTLTRWQSGDVVSRMGELANIRQFITGTSVTLVLDFVFALIYLAILVVYSWQLTLITLFTVAIYVVVNLIIAPVFKRILREKFQKNADNISFVIEALGGIQTVKAAAIEDRLIEKRDDLLAGYVKASFYSSTLQVFCQALGTFIYQIFTIGVLVVGAILIMGDKMSVGTLVAVQMLAGQVMQPLLRIVSVWQSFQQTRVSFERVSDIVDSDAEPSFNPNRATLPSISGHITFDKVVFSYKNDGAEIIKGLDLEIQPGQKIGIVGRSGSGKSTLVKLLQRLYIPNGGRVLIDGVDLAQVDTGWLRRQIGVVLQENVLFTGTIADNIALGDAKATRKEIVETAKLAGAHEFIAELPEHYDTELGENGTGLSGGQKQRVAIARALVADPRILIFDEATSALDYESEKIIMDNLETITKGRTAVFVAHRLSTIRNCDKIIVMERGRIVEQGKWDELLANRGVFYEMHSAQ
ncbi:MAG: type I secretion system permease/ATPase [Negativicutes bacterium]|jgi:subfamily B ATP-binding cassette protein HlyB/CyaB